MSKITVRAGSDHLASIATAKPIAALSELIWNGFDAKSLKVEVVTHFEPLLGSISSIQIKDSGTGIPFHKVNDVFGKLGESWKKQARLDGDRSLHGQFGRGRFKSLSLGANVCWETVYERGGSLFTYTILTDANRIGDFIIGEHQECNERPTGTTVEITNLSESSEELQDADVIHALTKEFALFLIEYPTRKLVFNSDIVDANEAWLDKSDYDIGEISAEDGMHFKASISIIEWNQKVQREIHYCDENGFSLFKEKIGPVIRAPGYDFTIYLKCNYFIEKAASNELSLNNLVPELKKIKDAAIQVAKEHFLERSLRDRSQVVDEWKKEQIYPYDENAHLQPAEIIERKVFDILAVNVQSYLKNFNSSDKTTKKFTFKLLSQAIKDNPASVQKIINEVLELKKKEQDDLAELLERTTLSSIISASKVVTDRLNFLNALDNCVHDVETKGTFLERDQLHKILEKETWIFREDFFLAGSEDWLEEVLQKHIKHLGKREAETTEDEVLEPVLLPGGKRGRVDLMFAKSRQPSEGYTEYLVIELKRPSQKVDMDVISQVEKYAMAVSADERFDHAKSKWTFIAVSNSMDQFAARKANQRGREKGKVMDDADINVEVWVMTWAEVINAARARLSFFKKQLRYEADRETAYGYLERAHKEYIPKPVIKPAAKV
ncbi:ATP-binding protein [Pantoea agglomerans]|uniref:ATP-binding protein n=1 Tax=Enterobacter agglomerans TaxID=549 RepID=UPI000450FF86|nr:ATP-binding protein [Pantoea agglomerans]EZI31878.1 hypothetical protein BW31_03857 [Pantoea agglomerans]